MGQDKFGRGKGLMGTDNLLPVFFFPPGICIGQGQLLHIAQIGERTCVIQPSMLHGSYSYLSLRQMQIEVRSGHGVACTAAAEFTYTSFIRQKPDIFKLRCVDEPAT